MCSAMHAPRIHIDVIHSFSACCYEHSPRQSFPSSCRHLLNHTNYFTAPTKVRLSSTVLPRRRDVEYGSAAMPEPFTSACSLASPTLQDLFESIHLQVAEIIRHPPQHGTEFCVSSFRCPHGSVPPLSTRHSLEAMVVGIVP